ncbi:hypothetical protein F5X99DRAFT_378537 [Biscogniauxia marginata]|nr:hypothetical protein F5X99DRAFT_378537 [Biscogniauxia marginata]
MGFACFFAGPFEVATGHSVFSGKGKAAIWLSIIAAAITTISHLQDFRDTEGDKLAGRKTVPLAIGDTNARVIVGLGVMVWTFAACRFWEAEWSVGAWLCLVGVMMVGNLFRDRSINGDTFTWKIFPLWLLGFFLLPFGTS